MRARRPPRTASRRGRVRPRRSRQRRRSTCRRPRPQARRRRARQLAAGRGDGMRFDDVAARLEPLPDPLPAAGRCPDAGPPRTDSARRGARRDRPIRAGRPAAVLVLALPGRRGRRAGRAHRAGDTTTGTTPARSASRREGRARGRRCRGDRPARGRRGGRRSTRSPPASGSSAPRPAVDPGQRLRGDARSSRSPTARPRWSPRPAEVARIVEPPVARSCRTRRSRSSSGGSRLAAALRRLRVDGLSVWGATARILSQLGAVLAVAPAEGRPTS